MREKVLIPIANQSLFKKLKKLQLVSLLGTVKRIKCFARNQELAAAKLVNIELGLIL